jgi:hypothetical protein
MLVPTQYQCPYGGYEYQATAYLEGWMLHRWPSEGPKIPPRTEILTDDGFKCVLSSAPFKVIRLDSILEVELNIKSA